MKVYKDAQRNEYIVKASNKTILYKKSTSEDDKNYFVLINLIDNQCDYIKRDDVVGLLEVSLYGFIPIDLADNVDELNDDELDFLMKRNRFVLQEDWGKNKTWR